MSAETTKRMLALYRQRAAVSLFLQSFFTSTGRSFHTSENVGIDIIRGGESIAIPVPDLTSDYNYIASDTYTNKEFKPPIYKEAVPINATDLIKRTPGQDPFQAPDFRANLIFRMFDAMSSVEERFRRAIEYQASQILQTGEVELIDNNGNVIYPLSFQPKATHFPTAAIDWDNANSTKIANIIALCEVIRNDGKADPNQAIFGSQAWELFLADDDVRERFETRRIDQGVIGPMQTNGMGGQYRGVLDMGNFRLDIWTYGGRYAHPSTGTVTPFVTADNVIVRSAGSRMDATFGAIPNIGQLLGAQTVVNIPELPARMSSVEGAMDLWVNTWMSANGEQLFAGIGTRPLLIPVAIDTYGCLNTIA